MFATLRRRSVTVLALALLVTACSSSSGKHASPTTTIATTSSTAATTTTVSPSHAVARLGRCPSSFPVPSLTALDSGTVQRLSTTLVPIAASVVLICQYNGAGGLAINRTLTGRTAVLLEDATNGLPIINDLFGCKGIHGSRSVPTTTTGTSQVPPSFLLTFANASQRVSVMADGCSRAVFNGKYTAEVEFTSSWFNELARYITITHLKSS
jgi:hypothetical protein